MSYDALRVIKVCVLEITHAVVRIHVADVVIFLNILTPRQRQLQSRQSISSDYTNNNNSNLRTAYL